MEHHIVAKFWVHIPSGRKRKSDPIRCALAPPPSDANSNLI